MTQTVLMVLVGLTLTHPPLHLWRPGENGLTDRLAAGREPALDNVTAWLSILASTGVVVAVAGVAVLALLVGSRRRWREAAFLGGAVAAQSAVFLLVTLCVDRPRPTAPPLDTAPPTSSFPSGHVGAAVALYGGLAVLAALRVRGRLRPLLCVLAALLPVLVAFSRLYRGMHHPTDVLAGLANGGTTLWIMWRAFLADRGRSTPSAGADRAPVGSDRASVGRAVVVYNPVLVDDDTLGRIDRVLAERGWAAPTRTATSVDDPGRGAAADAVTAGADLVVACGGDGTVTACSHALAGTGVALAIAPCGTGNLLARNLGLPSDPARALADALDGGPRRIDLALADGDGIPATVVSAMAGIGLDAATMADTSRSAKDRLGWPAYLPPLVRHLGDRRMRLTITLDDGRPIHRRAAMALIGNVGALQGGIRLLPGARPDDGLLDLVLLHPRGLAGWSAAAARLLTGRVAPGGGAAPFEHFQARRIHLTADGDQPRELDGESLPPGRTLRLAVRPAALLVHTPSGDGSPVDRSPEGESPCGESPLDEPPLDGPPVAAPEGDDPRRAGTKPVPAERSA
ncbi:diacylglycerol kinase family protein [Kitasatospora sp. A2-31]|uniref:diacylglycerol kinase family protein n=1 Tax=Kitasatospora sp. A2-31 TaxID=2916414 RepID=UPI001EEC28CD|nr:diacylglycerol kinase family protein [Kitasatospora sp. A2-31]MCG6497699.1 phosphatase PAP2 family protein [Kitasatospora sp. A2-31]